ncbi:MAG: sulfotransferase [Bacteroidales bacterium]|nr:sulfotransferase [Bacteroidales bacterium]
MKYAYGYIRNRLSLIKLSIYGILFRNKFKRVEQFCMFVGYPRTGHSLLGALLDAHPDFVIAMEWNVLASVRRRLTKHQIYWALVSNARNFRAKKDCTWTGYSYKVEDSWQGKFRQIKVIGDKMGSISAKLLGQDFTLIDKLEQKTGLRPKIIHVIRNPFDTITTMVTRQKQKSAPNEELRPIDFLERIYRYLENVNVMMKLKEQDKYEILDIYHEKLIEYPKETLHKIISFYNMQAEDEYYQNCAEIIYKQPNLSRFKVEWPSELIDFVLNQIKDIPYLAHYTYVES